MSASCTASSAVAKSAPRRTRTLNTRGTSARSATSSPSLGDGRRLVHEGPHLEPLVDRLAVGARCGRELTGELDRPLVAVDVDDHPPGDEVLRLRERPVDRGRTAVDVEADPNND